MYQYEGGKREGYRDVRYIFVYVEKDAFAGFSGLCYPTHAVKIVFVCFLHRTGHRLKHAHVAATMWKDWRANEREPRALVSHVGGKRVT